MPIRAIITSLLDVNPMMESRVCRRIVMDLEMATMQTLMKMALDLGRPVNPKLRCGIYGKHGSDQNQI